MEAAGCNLKAYMLAELNRAVELAVEVSRLINQASVRRYVVF